MSILPDWCQFVSSSSISACPQRVKYRPHLMGFLCFCWLTFQRYHALVCKTFLRKPHKWPSKYVGLSGALHPEFLSCHPSLGFCPLLPSETTKQLEILISQHKVTLAPIIKCHLGSQLPVCGGKFQVVAVAFVMCQLTWRKSLETQQEGGFLRHVKNIFTFVYMGVTTLSLRRGLTRT